MGLRKAHQIIILILVCSQTIISQELTEIKWSFTDPKPLVIDKTVKYTLQLTNTPEGEVLKLKCGIGNLFTLESNPSFEIQNQKLTFQDNSCDIEFDNETHIVLTDKNLSIHNIVFKEKKANEETEEEIIPANEDKNYPFTKEVFPFYDALQLLDKQNTSKILEKYNIDQEQLKKNNFLKTELKKIEPNVASLFSDNSANPSPAQEPSGIVGKIGGLDVTKYVDGLAKFLVKRTKQELSITFFEELKKKLQDEPDLNALFPSSSSTLQLIDKEIYNFERYISTLRDEFETDLKDLHKNFPQLIELHPQFFDKNPWLRTLITNTSEFIDDIKSGEHPGLAFESYNAKSFETDQKWLTQSLQTAQLFSKALKKYNSEEESDKLYWITKDQSKQLLRNESLLRIFLGLVAEQARKESLTLDDHLVFDLMNNSAQQYDRLKNFLEDITKETNQLNELIQKDEKSEESITPQNLASYFDASLAIFSKVKDVNTLFIDSNQKPVIIVNAQTLENALEVSTSIAELAGNVIEKKYGTAIFNLAGIIEHIIKLNKSGETEEVTDANGKKIDEPNQSFDFLQENYPQYTILSRLAKVHEPAKLITLYSLDNSAASHLGKIYTYYQKAWSTREGLSKTKKQLLKFGGFIATMAAAQNSDDIAAAIEVYALPSGSARIKRTSKHNISLNAFVGPYVGYEFQNEKDMKEGYVAGITVPVGIAWSWGKKSKSNNKSFSILASFIDIGAVVTYRFSDTESDIPKIYLREILSPGLFTSCSVGNVLSLNAGVQMAPRLKRIDETESNVSMNYSPRLSLSLVVDIPLLNFKTKE